MVFTLSFSLILPLNMRFPWRTKSDIYSIDVSFGRLSAHYIRSNGGKYRCKKVHTCNAWTSYTIMCVRANTIDLDREERRSAGGKVSKYEWRPKGNLRRAALGIIGRFDLIMFSDDFALWCILGHLAIIHTRAAASACEQERISYNTHIYL